MQNLTLAIAVRDKIRQHPETFRMQSWGTLLPPRGLFRRTPGSLTACLAGHTLLAAGYRMTHDNTFRRGRELVTYDEVSLTAREELGLTQEEYYFRYPWHKDEEICTLFCGAASNRPALAAFEAMIEWERAKLTRAA